MKRRVDGHMGASRLRGRAIVALFLSCGLACAAEPGSTARYRIDQPPQALADSLRSIARQTGVSVLFDPVAVAGRRSRAVAGQLTAAEAISRALDESGLEPVLMPDGSIVVRVKAPSPATPASGPAAGASLVSSSLAMESSDAAVVAAAPSRAPGSAVAEPVDSQGPTSLTRVEITGSRLKRIDADGPAPVNVYTRADIDRSGQPTLERFISSLNEASVSPGEGGSAATTGQGSVQLRGLPLGSTLVLINGRRVQAVGSSSGNFFNLNLIPMAAVERIEIVPVGSSAVYGGDALAGVVNVILRKSIDGLALEARLTSGDGIGDGGISIGTGGRGEGGSYVLLGSYSRTTPLTMAERDFFADADYRRFGGVDARTRSCTPGTVTTVSTANLPGLGSRFAGIPVLGAGQPLTAASFAATAGQPNLCNPMVNGHGMALVHGSENLALHVAGEVRLGEARSVFA